LKELIAYCRVSTKQQGQSGLGLEAQRSAVEGYAKQIGARVAGLYVEVESGRKSDRPELARALAHARRSKATLCVAKLDRLSRNAVFLGSLLESGIDVGFCDLPSVPAGATGRFILQQMASVAQLEAGLISERTKAALAAAKKAGTKLGSARPGHWNGREEARREGAKRGAQASAKIRSKAATEAYADLVPTVAELRAKGMPLHAIAAELNAQGHTTRRGKPWNPVQVSRVLERALPDRLLA
jgi:DNA invertase Pin-like site-specific DNA recombinase